MGEGGGEKKEKGPRRKANYLYHRVVQLTRRGRIFCLRDYFRSTQLTNPFYEVNKHNTNPRQACLINSSIRNVNIVSKYEYVKYWM